MDEEKNENTKTLVTDAMLAAGAREIETFDPNFESPEDAAERVFRAMLCLSALVAPFRGSGDGA
jgi:hypothetical protein